MLKSEQTGYKPTCGSIFKKIAKKGLDFAIFKTKNAQSYNLALFNFYQNQLIFSGESPGVSIIVPIKDTKNKFAVTIGRSLCIVTWDGESEVPEKIETLTSVEDGLKTQFNDGKVDPTGRLWVGTMSEIAPDGSWTPHLGSLYSFHKNGTSIKHLEKISVSNGLIWNKDQNKMFYIDSPTKRVDVLDFDPALGTISKL